MRLVLVVAVVVAGSSFAQSLPGRQASRLVLLAEPKAEISLPPPPQSSAGYLDPSFLLLQRVMSLEVRLLEMQRMSIAAPLTITLFGTTGAFVGALSMVAALGGGYGFLIVGIVALSISALPLLIGIPWLVAATSTNDRVDREIAQLKSERLRMVQPMSDAGPVPALRVAGF
jgi:hypothetical protein